MSIFSGLKEKITSSGFFNSPFYLQYHQYMVPGIVLVTGLLITILVTIPQLFKSFETSKRINELKEKNAFYQIKVSSLEGIDIELYKRNLDTALIALPVEKNIPAVAGELLIALGASGLSLDGITFASTPVEAGKISELAFKIEVSGSKDNLTNFLERIKLTPRIIKLTSIDISKSVGRINASIGFATLYQQLPEHIGSVDEAVPQITSEETQSLVEIETKARAMPQTAPAESGSTAVRGKLDPFSI